MGRASSRVKNDNSCVVHVAHRRQAAAPLSIPPGDARTMTAMPRIRHWVWFPFKVTVRFIARNGKRIAVSVAGFVLVAAGLVMLVLPGPGLLLVFVGLAVLATEYVWAQRALNFAKQKASQAKQKVRRGKRSAGHAKDRAVHKAKEAGGDRD